MSRKITSGIVPCSLIPFFIPSNASLPFKYVDIVSHFTDDCNIFRIPNIVIRSSSIIQILSISLIKINVECGTFAYFAGYFNFSVHRIYLIFGNIKSDSSCFGMVMKGFVHTE